MQDRSLLTPVRCANSPGLRMHVVDTTLFYSPTSGGVKRYLTAKHAWLTAHTSWQHSMVVPGDTEYVERGGLCTVPGFTLPGTFNYRLPMNPRRWTALLDALEPDLIEVGDAFHPAWCAWRVAQRRGIPLVAFYPVSYTHLRAHETRHDLVCRLLLLSIPLYSSAASEVYKRQSSRWATHSTRRGALGVWRSVAAFHSSPSIIQTCRRSSAVVSAVSASARSDITYAGSMSVAMSCLRRAARCVHS